MMKIFTYFAILLTFLAFIGSNVTVANALPVVAIEPSSTEVFVGEEFSIEVVITKEDIINMAAWSGILFFDPDIISFQNAKLGEFAPSGSMLGFNEPVPGELRMLVFNLSRNNISGQGTLVVVNFRALKPGITLIEPFDFAFADPDASKIPVDIGEPANISVVLICEGDFDCDGDVDGSDLAVFADDFGRTDCSPDNLCYGDFDGDGDVDGIDLTVFASDFGRTDCPACPD